MRNLSGPVVFIDDELDDDSSRASALLREIEATGRPVASATEIPEDYDAHFEHWRSLAYLIVDWDLTEGSLGGQGAATLSSYERSALFDFLCDLMAAIYCPIFIVSDEDVADIERQLREEDRFLKDGVLDGRIAVFSKSVVLDNLSAHLAQWVSGSPALSALKAWEQEHDTAKNLLFAELNEKEPGWPALIWQSAVEDGIDPAYELTTVITTNLLNRLNPVAFDQESISHVGAAASSASLRQVSLGRTSVPGARLAPGMVLPGDVFALDGDDLTTLWINISPACQTVGRPIRNAEGEMVQSPVILHLLRGERQTWPPSEKALNAMNSKDILNSLTIHTLVDDHPYKFSFRNVRIEEWANVASHRKARLLPPYVTRLQQLYSAFMQSAGLPRTSFEMYRPPS